LTKVKQTLTFYFLRLEHITFTLLPNSAEQYWQNYSHGHARSSCQIQGRPTVAKVTGTGRS